MVRSDGAPDAAGENNFKARVSEMIWIADPAGLSDSRNDIPNEYDALIDGLIVHIENELSMARTQEWFAQALSHDWDVTLAPKDLEMLITRAYSDLHQSDHQGRPR